MKTREHENFFKAFQRKKEENSGSSDVEIFNLTFKESRFHEMYKKELRYHVEQELNRLAKEERESKKEKQRMFEDPAFIAGAHESEASYNIEAGIHEGTIPKDKLGEPIYKGKSPKDFGFGPPR